MYYAGNGNLIALKRIGLKGNIDLTMGDYDRRTPLHIAASEGRLNVISYLIEECTGVAETINQLDRWSHTWLDDTIDYGFAECRDFLLRYGGKRGSEIEKEA